MKKIEKPEQKYCDYLEELRQSGVTNMFGAVPYLMERFGLERSEAKQILSNWMETYEGQ